MSTQSHLHASSLTDEEAAVAAGARPLNFNSSPVSWLFAQVN